MYGFKKIHKKLKILKKRVGTLFWAQIDPAGPRVASCFRLKLPRLTRFDAMFGLSVIVFLFIAV
jgi:hypothetical protein